MDVNDESGLDLSPRQVAAGPDGRGRASVVGGGRRLAGVGVVLVVLAVGAFAVSQALGDATLFFRNADEAVAQRDELGTDRFRLQGLVAAGTVESYPGGVAFDVTYNGVAVPVEHTGDPQELFQEDIPVVLEGRWSSTADDAVFLSDRMLVKHDENYDAEHPGRSGDGPSGSAGSGGAMSGDDGGDAAGAPTP